MFLYQGARTALHISGEVILTNVALCVFHPTIDLQCFVYLRSLLTVASSQIHFTYNLRPAQVVCFRWRTNHLKAQQSLRLWWTRSRTSSVSSTCTKVSFLINETKHSITLQGFMRVVVLSPSNSLSLKAFHTLSIVATRIWSKAPGCISSYAMLNLFLWSCHGQLIN